MPRSEALKKAQDKYKKEKTIIINIRLHNERDADIIEQLKNKGSKQGYIKQLIRSDISNEEIERLEISLLNTLENLMKVEAYTEAKKLIKDLTEIKLKKQEIQKVELSRLANKT